MSRGFASIAGTERLREQCSLAGKKAHAEGRAHQWTSEQAREAAIKGVQARRERKLARPPIDQFLHGRLA